MEVRVRLVPAAVFKTVEPCGTTRLVGSIPMHFRWVVSTPVHALAVFTLPGRFLFCDKP